MKAIITVKGKQKYKNPMSLKAAAIKAVKLERRGYADVRMELVE